MTESVPASAAPLDVTDMATAPSGVAVFDTAIGHCSLAWGPRGLVGVQLPEVPDGHPNSPVYGHLKLPHLN